MKPAIPPDLDAEIDGVCVARPVFSINLFASQSLSELGSAALAPLRRYRELVGESALRFYATANMSKHKPTTKRALTMLETWLQPGARLGDYNFLNFQDAEDYNHAPTTLFIVAGREEVDGERSDDATLVRISLPVQWGLDEPDRMFALAAEMWAQLPYRSGQAGFTLEISRYYIDAAHEHAYGRSMRHPGLDIHDAANDAIMAGFDRVRGVGWLTMLDDAFVQQLGGMQTLRAKLGSAEMFEQEHGVILRAGAAPQFGDVNRKDDLPAYRAVYNAIKPLLPDPATAPSLNIGGDFASRNEAWLTRFGR
jgi:hypothetical protein